MASQGVRASLVVPTIRGLLLDLLATGDRDRVEAAAECFRVSLQGVWRRTDRGR